MSRTESLETAVERLWNLRTDVLRIATPLGLGKPNALLNALYRRFRDQASAAPKRLEIFTALSLDPPSAGSDLERRFLEPFLERHFGADYPRLEFVQDLKDGRVPPHVRIHEFYAQAGAYLGKIEAQTDYVSLNYTHVAGALYERGLDALVQLVAARPGRVSLSCNADLTLDVADRFREGGRPLLKIAVVHPDLPFLGGDAELPEDFFDLTITPPGPHSRLFALPLNSLDSVDHMIGFHAARLVRDGGTLQVGIGSLSDALVAALLWRHRDPASFGEAARRLPDAGAVPLHDGPFAEGLYGTSEMMMDGFMHLRRAGILKREICDLDERRRRYMHAAFFLGSADFYEWLRGLRGADYEGLGMTRVSKVNDLYDDHEWALRRQRRHARFFNTCMKVSLLGGAMSDTLNDGQVVSGIGGQYNFVAMSHELRDARSALLLRSTRRHRGRRESNVATDLRQLSIPRHLRDVVITEYGIADLRGRTDEECVQALIAVADSKFQDELAAWGIENKKLRPGYRVPEAHRRNTRARLEEFVARHRGEGRFEEEPFGSSFTATEKKLKPALLGLREASAWGRLRLALAGAFRDPAAWAEELRRLQLENPRGARETLLRWAVLGALAET